MIDATLRSVLAIHPGGLGDVLLALPALRALRIRFLAHRLMLIAGPEIGGLLKACEVVDEIFSVESRDVAGLFSGGLDRSSSLRQRMAQCDAAVGWLRDSDGALRDALTEAGVGQVVVESPSPRPGIHQSLRFMEIAGGSERGCSGESGLSLPESLKREGAGLLQSVGIREGRSVLVCHPGSGSPAKCVRPELLADVIRRLAKADLTPVIVAGPADDAALECLTRSGIGDVPVFQRQPLAVLAGILGHARLFIGHDSGVTHLAAALCVPTVALFGPTDPRQWAPQGAQVSALTGSPCTCRTWEMVRACAEKSCLSFKPDDILDAAITLSARYLSVTKS